MLEKIITKSALLDAVPALKKKRFKPGFDGMSIDGADSTIRINGERLCKDIIRGDYCPMPAVGFRSAKHGGGFRSLSKISAIDAVVQNVLLKEVSAKTEDVFSNSSFAYRSGRGVTAAAERFVTLANHHRFVLRLDINNCFDNVNHNVLKERLRGVVDDEVANLCMTFVKTPIYIDNQITPTEKGLLQGMPLSPVLCNVYLHSLDTLLEEMGAAFVRYGDDIAVFGNDHEELRNIQKRIGEHLATLSLSFNKQKTKIESPAKTEFLGFKFTSDKKGLTATSAQGDKRHTNLSWRSVLPKNNYHRVELISDGILRQKGASLLFDTDTVDTAIPVVNTDVINVYSNVIFDSGSIETAMKNQTEINIFNRYGELVGSFVPNTPLKAPRVTHEQLSAYYNDDQRLNLAKDFVLASIHNENLVIRYYNKQNPNECYEKVLRKLQQSKTKIKAATSMEELLMLEAGVRKLYYSCFDHFIKRSDFVFNKRSKRPSQNNVNAMISFANTVLYNHIATEIQKTPLDVRVGFLHSTTARLKSLNLDIAEAFKPLIVDRTVFTLINKGEILPSHFEQSKNGAVYLSSEGKHILLKAINSKLEVKLKIGSEELSYRQIIVQEIRSLVRFFRKGEKFKAYRQVR